MSKANKDIFQAISDPSRREILKLLSEKGSLPINSLVDNFEMSRPAVSKHIKILNSSGFIKIKKDGRKRYCILHQEGFNQLHKWISYYDQFWNSKLDKLDSILKNKKR